MELTKLAVLLAKADIPFEIYPFSFCGESTFMIASPNEENRVIDAVCHKGSCGGKKGLLEIMAEDVGFFDDVLGDLTAEQAFEYFVRCVKKS